MTRMSEQVRRLVGMENLLVKARRRHRECEREEQGADGERAARYKELIARISEEIHSAGRPQLEEYLACVEQDFLPRMARRVQTTLYEMVEAAKHIVDGRIHLLELRTEYTDALERIRSVRERLDLDPFKPVEIRFGLGTHPPNAERRTREAHDLVKGHLRS